VLINAWLQEILSVLQVQPPLVCSWSSHSLRSGGASAAFALGVDLLVIMNWGLWSTLDSLHLYVDVPVQPYAATALFLAICCASRAPPLVLLLREGLVCIYYLPWCYVCVFLGSVHALACQTPSVGGSSSMALSLLPIDRNARITIRGFVFLPGREGQFLAGRVSAM